MIMKLLKNDIGIDIDIDIDLRPWLGVKGSDTDSTRHHIVGISSEVFTLLSARKAGHSDQHNRTNHHSCHSPPEEKDTHAFQCMASDQNLFYPALLCSLATEFVSGIILTIAFVVLDAMWSPSVE